MHYLNWNLSIWECLQLRITIFQLYCGFQFYWWRKPEYPEKHVTQKLYSLPEQVTVHSVVFIWSMLIIHCLLCLFILIIYLSFFFFSFFFVTCLSCNSCFIDTRFLSHKTDKNIIDFLMGSVLFIFLVFCVVFFVLLVFVLCLVYPVLPVSMDFPFWIALSVFSNVDLASNVW